MIRRRSVLGLCCPSGRAARDLAEHRTVGQAAAAWIVEPEDAADELARRVKPGDRVARGQPLVILEAMKIEHTLTAPFKGTVAIVSAREGNQVSEGVVLARIDAAE